MGENTTARAGRVSAALPTHHTGMPAIRATCQSTAAFILPAPSYTHTLWIGRFTPRYTGDAGGADREWGWQVAVAYRHGQLWARNQRAERASIRKPILYAQRATCNDRCVKKCLTSEGQDCMTACGLPQLWSTRPTHAGTLVLDRASCPTTSRILHAPSTHHARHVISRTS